MMIKKISALFAALCMVLSVSCAKSTPVEAGPAKKSDSSKSENLSENEKTIANIQRFVDNIKTLSEDYSDELFDETVDLYISNGKNPLLANPSKEMQQEMQKRVGSLLEKEKYQLTLVKVVDAAQKKMAQ